MSRRISLGARIGLLLAAGATTSWAQLAAQTALVGTVTDSGGLVVPSGNVHIILKPTLEMGDDEFKREAHRKLAETGMVIAAFDNEPTHVNDYRRAFPDATIVHLATDHSGRAVALLDGIVTVPHFGDAPGRPLST